MARASKKIAFSKTCKGTRFEIRETGMNWTIFYKERSKPFKRIQSVTDLKIARQIVDNQTECKPKIKRTFKVQRKKGKSKWVGPGGESFTI